MSLREKRAVIAEMFASLVVRPVGKGRQRGRGDALEVTWNAAFTGIPASPAAGAMPGMRRRPARESLDA
ncbi:hypothetical protein D5H75_11020 [Bailinhaonella thermotolerans]|uniref:Uncharacterized protein n=1 Tax=Bailinhaonella thermotolerans TaxID=1070861 RepID=A0A3A4B4S2_9ACTN|nr:hypothetical protein D5H75_11020 [Bailinhaonella thermotolerans]